MDPSLGAVSAYIAKAAGPKLAATAQRQIARRRWRLRLARRAFAELPRPRLRHHLAKWLELPVNQRVLLSPDGATAEAVEFLDAYLGVRSAKWGDLPVSERRRRTEAVLGHVYEGVLREVDPSYAISIASIRSQAASAETRAEVAEVREEVRAVGVPVRFAYLEQVRRIAPERLEGRDQELAELANFCTKPEQGLYVWWRAPAWAGKSALMSWFVLHPPAGVRVVSFFITARYPGQSDRVAFVNAVLEQLAFLLDEPMPYLSATTHEQHLLAMLNEAAEGCQRDGQRLVLVVDGLDEDRGVTADPDAHSIAATLPAHPPAGMRIIVAGRPDPPVPGDVGDGHPLRRPDIVRVLGQSPRAEVIRADAQRELQRLLHGTRAEQDLLGLLTAAEGGLSGPDLAELTGSSLGEIEEHLHAVSGRTFTSRTSHYQPDTAPEVYLPAHEELQQTAAKILEGPRLEAYRQRLHTWADGYRQQGWPAATPEYLLRGYYQMLRDAGDLPRMIAFATDTARHNRMLDITGGDAAAFTEIEAAQALALRQDDPDLLAMARLATCRDDLESRNSNIPIELPAAWVSVGKAARAEVLARSITDPWRQAQALAAVAKALADAGDLDRAEAVAQSIDNPWQQAEALAAVARALAAAGKVDQVRTVGEHIVAMAGSITHPFGREQVLATLVGALAAAGAHERAENVARDLTHLDWQTQALTMVAKAAAASGDSDRAVSLLQDAEMVARSATNPYQRDPLLVVVAAAAGVCGDHDRAAALLNSVETMSSILRRDLRGLSFPGVSILTAMSDVAAVGGDQQRSAVFLAQASTEADRIQEPKERAKALVAVAEAAISIGDSAMAASLLERAESTAWEIGSLGRRVSVLIAVARAAAAAGCRDKADAALGDAEAVARRIDDLGWRAENLTSVAEAVAAAGDRDRATSLLGTAETLARSVIDKDRLVQGEAGLLEVLIAVGDYDRLETFARGIADPSMQAMLLAALATELPATSANRERVAGLLKDAASSARARGSTDPEWRSQAVVDVVEALTATGHIDQAAALLAKAEADANSVTDPERQAKDLRALVPLFASLDDHSHAEAVAQSITHPITREDALMSVARALVNAGDHDRAETIARSISHYPWEYLALGELTKALAAVGNYDRAETIARSISDKSQRAQALAELAKAVASEGDLERATALLADARALVSSATWSVLVEAYAAAGDYHQAEAAAQNIPRPRERVEALVNLAKALAASENRNGSAAVFAEAERVVLSMPDNDMERGQSQAMLVEALTAVGDYDHADDLARTISTPKDQGRAQAALVGAFIASGDSDRAEALARRITDPDLEAQALATVATALGQPRARRLICEALSVGHWTKALNALAKLDQAVFEAIIDERTASLLRPMNLDYEQTRKSQRRAMTRRRSMKILTVDKMGED